MASSSRAAASAAALAEDLACAALMALNSMNSAHIWESWEGMVEEELLLGDAIDEGEVAVMSCFSF